MKRLGLALVAFWAVILGAVVLVALQAEDPPEAPAKAPGPMTCASLQKRAERCADGLSSLAGELYTRYARQQGENELAVNTKVTVVVSVVYGAIGEKKVAHYCRRYWGSKRPLVRRVRARLAACFAEPGCKPFVACVRRLALRLDLTDLL